MKYFPYISALVITIFLYISIYAFIHYKYWDRNLDLPNSKTHYIVIPQRYGIQYLFRPMLWLDYTLNSYQTYVCNDIGITTPVFKF